MKITYENPYTINANALIFIYIKLNKYQRSSNQFVRKIAFVGNLIFKRFALALVVNNKQMLVKASINGMQFTARSTNSQFHSIYFDDVRNCYEPDVYGAIEEFLPEGGTMLDVGSNWGHHTFDAAVRKNANVFAFEPNVDVFNDLSRIVSGLNLEQRVVPYNVGLGYENGVLTHTQVGFESGVGSVDDAFLSHRVINQHWLVRLFDKLTLKKNIVQTAKIKVLDDFFDSKTVISFIKLDCEGSELSALKGAPILLERDKPVVVFELHTNKNSSNYTDFFEFFEPLGYELFEINTDVDAGNWDIKAVDTLVPNTHYNLLAKCRSLIL
tara:strand:- start:155 stop:1132 length:978 start_codon:yes stop_codon:yes gene_type:complete